MPLLLAVVFVLSGAAGLIYESIWSKYLGLFVGHSAYAQVIVLVIFLGGMSLGATLASRRTEALKHPLIGYAIVEGIVGLIGFVFHDTFTVVTNFAYGSIFPALAGGTALVVAKWALGAALILPQSILLGATFPLMSAGLIRLRDKDGLATGVLHAGRSLAVLYFANSLGAAVGGLLTGFYLIGAFGLPGTVLTAAGLNVGCALVVYLAARQHAIRHADTEAPSTVVRSTEGIELRALRRLLLATAFGTAVASFVYEISWVRMLSLVLGSATHSFELMLSAFIVGLSLGALWLRTRADTMRDPMRTLAIIQWLMGAFAIATLWFYLSTFRWTAGLITALNVNDTGYTMFTVARYGICLVLMLPATFCAGITLPLITRMLMTAGGGERAIGQVYAVNTIGSIVGAGLAALVLMPVLGVRNLLLLGGAIDIALGVVLAISYARRVTPALVVEERTRNPGTMAPRRLATLLLAGALAIVVGAAVDKPFDRALLTSGVYRYGKLPEDGGEQKMLYYADGRTATVSVKLANGATGRPEYSLATNGKPDASLSMVWFDSVPKVASTRRMESDEATQLMLPMLTLAHAPKAKRAAVIGQGSGMSSHFLLGSPYLDSLTTIDIEPEMVRASHTFLKANHRVFDDPRSRFVYDDAKSYFAASKTRYDLILSEPSNPWVSGVSGLFTDEFYGRVKQYLTPDGVFGQWLHLYEIDDASVLSVIKAVHKHFASYRIYLTMDVDIIIVASNKPSLAEPDWGVYQYPKIADDLKRFLPLDRGTLQASLLITRDGLAPLVENAQGANSDFFPVLDLAAERTRFMRKNATGFFGMTGERYDIGAALEGRTVPLRREMSTTLDLQRLNALTTGARMRAHLPPPVSDSAPEDRGYRAALVRAGTLDAILQYPGAPPEWSSWIRQAMDVERDVHGGSMGEVDSAFYGRLLQYADSRQAPDDLKSALRFMRAISTYDWPTAAKEANVQIRARLAGHWYLNNDVLRDGATIAFLKTGNPRRALDAFIAMNKFSTRERSDMRGQLLMAWVARAQRDGASEKSTASRK